MAQVLDLVPWPQDASPICAAPGVLIPLEPKKIMLAGVKDHLYHPCLPTLRRMDMDTVANRLTDEHSRTTTTCSKEDFQRATFTLAGVPSKRLPSLVSRFQTDRWPHGPVGCMLVGGGKHGPGRAVQSVSQKERPTSNKPKGMTELGKSLTARYRAGKMAPLPPSTNQEEWPSYTRAMEDWSRFVSAAGEFKLPSLNRKVLGFSCYAVRYLKPDVTQTWRYCLNQNPSLDRYGPKPIPYNTVNTYRSFGTAHSRSHYLEPWR